MSKCGVTAKTRDFGDGKWLQRNGDPLPGLYVTMHIWLQSGLPTTALAKEQID